MARHPRGDVQKIRAPLFIQFAENDKRINARWPDTKGRSRPRRAERVHSYPETQHGFQNNSTPRYKEAAAELAWERTIAFFKKHLA